jgi:dynein heavy chain 1
MVFNCDESFDAEAMQRILTGLCQVGSFVTFDEFNRLEEAQLSAGGSLRSSLSLARTSLSLARTRLAREEADVAIAKTKTKCI